MKTERARMIAFVGVAVGGGLLVLLLQGTSCWELLNPGSSARLRSGKSVQLDELPSPLTASVLASQYGRTITFVFRLVDAEGKEVSSLRLPAGRPAPPKVEVLDEAGKRVYTCTLQYG